MEESGKRNGLRKREEEEGIISKSQGKKERIGRGRWVKKGTKRKGG